MKTTLLAYPRVAALCAAALLCAQLNAQTEVLPATSPANSTNRPTSSGSNNTVNSEAARAGADTRAGTDTRTTTGSSLRSGTSSDESLNASADATPRAGSSMNANSNNKLSRSDRTFIEKAAKSGMKEVAVSNAVSAKLTGAGLAELSQMMVADHTALNTELKALAARKGVTLPMDDDATDEASRWARNNKDVNDEYLEEMKDDHEASVDVFERGAKTEDAEIAAFAAKHLPKIKAHLEHIKSLDKKN